MKIGEFIWRMLSYKGDPSSQRTQNLLVIVWILSVWTGCCVSKGEFLPFEPSHVGILLLVIGGKAYQTFLEFKKEKTETPGA